MLSKCPPVCPWGIPIQSIVGALNLKEDNLIRFGVMFTVYRLNWICVLICLDFATIGEFLHLLSLNNPRIDSVYRQFLVVNLLTPPPPPPKKKKVN